MPRIIVKAYRITGFNRSVIVGFISQKIISDPYYDRPFSKASRDFCFEYSLIIEKRDSKSRLASVHYKRNFKV